MHIMDEYIIKNYNPISLCHFFEDISAIPRGSGNEGGIADFLVRFAADRGLEHCRDTLNNVLIKAPASPGYEKEPAVLLQGHTDMVCEKNSDTVHDFLTDPLDLYVEDGWLRARGTTLGADNGIAVAVMLALLDGEAPEHPALECLFTVEEEVGLAGAAGFDYSLISARRMINMDSEGEGQAVVGCAGGMRTAINIPAETAPAAGEAVTIKISGLMGGHSGMDIGTGRANANILMGRLLLALRRDVDYNLISITGGLMDNAIPRECEAVVTTRDRGVICERAGRIAATIAGELVHDDSGFRLDCAPCTSSGDMFTCAATRRVISLLGSVANGVFAMSADVPGLVEFSRNLGIVRTNGGNICLTFSSRSAIQSRLEASADSCDALAELCGGTAEHYNRYPGWRYEKDSPLRDKYIAACRRVFRREPGIIAIHAGLECGLIKAAVPDMDIISIGPDMKNIHTPKEALNLESCERFWQILVGMLRK